MQSRGEFEIGKLSTCAPYPSDAHFLVRFGTPHAMHERRKPLELLGSSGSVSIPKMGFLGIVLHFMHNIHRYT